MKNNNLSGRLKNEPSNKKGYRLTSKLYNFKILSYIIFIILFNFSSLEEQTSIFTTDNIETNKVEFKEIKDVASDIKETDLTDLKYAEKEKISEITMIIQGKGRKYILGSRYSFLPSKIYINDIYQNNISNI